MPCDVCPMLGTTHGSNWYLSGMIMWVQCVVMHSPRVCLLSCLFGCAVMLDCVYVHVYTFDSCCLASKISKAHISKLKW